MLPLDVEMCPRQKYLQRSVEIRIETLTIEDALGNATSDRKMCLRQK